MGLGHSPSIAQNGLIICLDAANTRSYSGSGTAWNDISGNGLNGTQTNGPSFVNGNGGYHVYTGASNHYTNIPDNTLHRLTGSMTLEVVIYPTSFPNGGGGGGFILAKAGAYYLELKNSGVLRTYFYGLNSAGYHDGLTTLALNSWSHVVAVLNLTSGTITTYVNGVVDRTVTGLTGSVSAATNSIQIGAFSGGSYSFNGRIATARLYNRNLTASEITQNFNALRGRFGL